MGGFQPIGEMLVSYGKLTEEQLSAALSERRNGRKRLGEVLVGMGYISEQDIAQCLSVQFGYEMVRPEELLPEVDALALFDPCFAFDHGVLPLHNREDVLECAIADPLDVIATDSIIRHVRKRVVFRIATRSALREAIKRSYALGANTCTVEKTEKARRRRSIKPQVDRAALLALFDVEVGIATDPRPIPSPRRERSSAVKTSRRAGDQL